MPGVGSGESSGPCGVRPTCPTYYRVVWLDFTRYLGTIPLPGQRSDRDCDRGPVPGYAGEEARPRACSPADLAIAALVPARWGITPHNPWGADLPWGSVPRKSNFKGWRCPVATPVTRPLSFGLLSLGHLKAQVYATPVKSLGQLRRRLGVAIRSTLPSAIRAVLDQVPTRARLCLRRRGRDLEGVLPHH